MTFAAPPGAGLAADDDAGGARSPGVPFGGLAEGINLAAVPALSRPVPVCRSSLSSKGARLAGIGLSPWRYLGRIGY